MICYRIIVGQHPTSNNGRAPRAAKALLQLPNLLGVMPITNILPRESIRQKEKTGAGELGECRMKNEE